MQFAKALKDEKVSNLSTRPPVVVSPQDSLQEVIRKLGEKKSGCAIVVENKKVVGIFTDQDALRRGLLPNNDLATPIAQLMSSEIKTLDPEDSIAAAARMMHIGRYRHLPVTNAENELLSLVSIRDIVYYLSENYPGQVYNLPPNPHQVMPTPEGA